MKTTRTVTLILIVSETREPPSSTFTAAPVINVEGEAIAETIKPLAKVLPLAAKLKRFA